MSEYKTVDEYQKAEMLKELKAIRGYAAISTGLLLVLVLFFAIQFIL